MHKFGYQIMTTLIMLSFAAKADQATWNVISEKIISTKSVLISVDTNGLKDQAWVKDICKTIHQQMQEYRVYPGRCRLQNNETTTLKALDTEKSSPTSDQFHFQLKVVNSDEYTLHVRNLIRDGDSDFDELEWIIHPGQSKDETKSVDAILQDKIGLLVHNVANYDRYKDDIRTIVLAGGLSSSTKLQVNKFEQVVMTANQKVLNDKQAYQVFVNEDPKNKHYARAAIETGILLGMGTWNYWRYTLFKKDKVINPNEVDWKYDGIDGQKRKYKGFNGIRFDDNSRDTNFGHTLAGVLYYQVARSNNLSTMESFLYTLTASTFWETASEYREVVSINDTFFTAVGGFVMGEVLHQFGKYLHDSGSFVGKGLSIAFDSASAMNRFLDRRHNQDISQFGFDPKTFGNFDFYTGVTTVKDQNGTSSGKSIGARGQLQLIPLFTEAGKAKGLYTDTAFAELSMNLTQRSDAAADFSVFAKAVMAAYYQKNITLSESQKKNGYTMFVGVSSAVEFNQSGAGQTTDEKDWNGIVHVVGTTLDMTAYIHDVKVRMTVDVYGDFAMMKSFAFESFRMNNDVSGSQSVLLHNGYYYGWGLTNVATVSVDYKGWVAGATVKGTSLNSISGRSQNMEAVTQNFEMSDNMITGSLWAQKKIGKSWKVRVAYEKTSHKSNMKNSNPERITETSLSAQLAYEF